MVKQCQFVCGRETEIKALIDYVKGISNSLIVEKNPLAENSSEEGNSSKEENNLEVENSLKEEKSLEEETNPKENNSSDEEAVESTVES